MSGPGIETQALASMPFFSKLSPEDLEGILGVGQEASFAAGSAIVEEGDVGDGMYIVLEGVARVEVGGRYHDLKAGGFFGEMALITDSRRMATVKAHEDVRALKIPAEDFQSFLLQHPTVAVAMLKAAIGRLREVEQRIDAWMAS
ncbi:MAG: family protein phosphatase [Actinomycetota bacterium]|jgi:CPA2 family monovalent cation:H+ antiporter-2|nr:family protein phosphatase [Actinomycetota bacterium]